MVYSIIYLQVVSLLCNIFEIYFIIITVINSVKLQTRDPVVGEPPYNRNTIKLSNSNFRTQNIFVNYMSKIGAFGYNKAQEQPICFVK